MADKQKTHELALIDLTKAIEVNPNDAVAYCNRGEHYLSQKNYELALIDCIKAIELNPDYYDAYNNMGVCYDNKGNYELALVYYNKAIELNPDDVAAYYNRGSCYENKGNYELALIDCTKAIKLKPDFTEAYYNRGSCYIKQGNYELALIDFNKAIELNPNLVEAYTNRGYCYDNQENYEPALIDYAKAIELNQNYVNAYNNRGACYFKQGNHELALVDLSKSIELNPNYAEAYSNRGNCYFKQENYELALIDFNKAIELNPDYTYAYIHRAGCYDKKENYELALADYTKAIELNPSLALTYNNRGICYSNQKKYELALADYDKAIELNSDLFDFYNNKGICYLNQKNYELALISFTKAIALNPDSDEAYFCKSLYYSKQEKYDSALSDIDNAIKLSDSLETKKNYCFFAKDVACHAKKYDKASAYIEQAFENIDAKEQFHKNIYLEEISKTEQLNEAYEKLKKRNQQLVLEIEKTKTASNALHEKEQEMISFFTHTLRNALASAPESLRQAIRLLGSEDYEKNKKYYKAINKITALFSTLSLTDCLIDTFKQSINDPEEFKLAWQKDNTGDATPKWVIASALRQSLNRIIFMSDASQLEKLLNVTETSAIVSTRKSFIETVLPLNIDNQGIKTFYDWLNGINTIEISIAETNHSNFGINQVKFSLLFAITSEILLNALKYWNGTGHIQISWQLTEENYIFTVKNPCHANASSNLAGTHKGIAFINRLMELLGDQAHFNCIPEEQQFTAQLKLHKSLLGDNT